MDEVTTNVPEMVPQDAQAEPVQPEVAPEVAPEAPAEPEVAPAPAPEVPAEPAVEAEAPHVRADMGKVFERNGIKFVRTTDAQGNVVDIALPTTPAQ